MVLDILALAVEGVVDDPRGLVLGAVEAAADDTAQGSRAGLLGSTESEAEHCCGWRGERIGSDKARGRGSSRGVVGATRWRIPVSGPVIRRELGLMSAPSP